MDISKIFAILAQDINRVLIMNIPRRNHYVPEFYLRSFVNDNDKLFVYYKGECRVEEQNVTKTTVIRDFYNIKNDDGTIDYRLEKEFSKSEGIVKPIITKLIKTKDTLSNSEKNDLSQFMALMVVRIPQMVNISKEIGNIIAEFNVKSLLQSPDKFNSALEHINSKEKPEDRISPDKFAAIISKFDSNNIEIDEKYALGMSIQGSIPIHYFLMKKNWTILHAPDNYFFITSDAPVVSFIRYNDKYFSLYGGFGEYDNEVCFPLSPNKCLYLSMKKEENHVITPKEINTINTLIATAAEFIFISHIDTKDLRKLCDNTSVTVDHPKVNKNRLLEKLKHMTKRK
ncbi:MAG: DUF4238 domain-containing protein [FCB group bacterium]|nr:DUF4238 domain-containing protein [FCB group bacterium]